MRLPPSSTLLTATCALAALVLPPDPGAGGQELADLRRALRSDQPEERASAYRQIAGLEGEAREAAGRLLETEHRRWASALGAAVRRTDGLVAEADRLAARRAEQVAAWEQAAREAFGAVFDEQLFPAPAGAISGPHEGYQAVMARVGAATGRFDPLRRAADKDLRKALRLERDDAVELLDELTGSHARAHELALALEEMGAPREEPERPGDVALTALCLAAGEWEATRAALASPAPPEGELSCQVAWFPPGGDPAEGERSAVLAPSGALEGYGRFLAHHVLAELVEAGNGTLDLRVPTEVRAAVATLNLHRRALGVRPLQLHPALTQAIRDHLWTLRHLTHEGSTPETRTAAQRIRGAGYPAPYTTGENLSTADIVAAMEQWKWDGGHYRILVHPCAVHVGAWQAAFSGMVVAAGEPPLLPSPVLLVLER